ncbi:DUF1440 domain-containing protein [Dyadobacter pollutisoli]|jgi:hypothetical protein|uniref:DUF1440 domain-containing protein n=1 Tax=Dyadobacter pollutisoli TaxID=2910158 RepID=A0A9E8NCJ9_9BACT|nr:DUF1440 domain-containing protein [Dyadobacter pollutisoli]WAC14179.1 DUF1440 domain-containing protein [Dyadobacter pollutisoli]
MGRLTISGQGFKTILSATFVAGALDIIVAILVYAMIMGKTTPSRIILSIASGIFGKEAYSGGTAMVLTGLVLHFFIAFLFSVFYYFLYQNVASISGKRVTSGILYGIFIWVVMNLIVLRIVFPAMPAPELQAIATGMSIVIVAVGIPISYIISAGSRRW